jgi:hypothetical protein
MVYDLERWPSFTIAWTGGMWDPARWSTTPDGVTVCDGPSSPRNPQSPNSLAEDNLRWISRILHTTH